MRIHNTCYLYPYKYKSGVRIVNREPGDRINTGFPGLSYAPWYYFGTKIAMSKNE